MNYKQTEENTKQTSLRLPKNMYEEIERLAKEYERKPAEQIRYMLNQYLKMIK